MGYKVGRVVLYWLPESISVFKTISQKKNKVQDLHPQNHGKISRVPKKTFLATWRGVGRWPFV